MGLFILKLNNVCTSHERVGDSFSRTSNQVKSPNCTLLPQYTIPTQKQFDQTLAVQKNGKIKTK